MNCTLSSGVSGNIGVRHSAQITIINKLDSGYFLTKKPTFFIFAYCFAAKVRFFL